MKRYPAFTEEWLKDISRGGVKEHAAVGGRGGGAVTDRGVSRNADQTRTTVKSSNRTSNATNLFASFHLALTGQLPSGKNQVQQLWRNGKVHRYPNKTFTNWRASCHIQILTQTLQHEPITTPVRLTVEYWPGDARTRDVSGQLDALFSLLVYSKILVNDGLVHELGGWTRRPINRQFPKVLVMIEALP